ncbi:hypothetical protein niasHT_037770 [Heterodera trifolii]|uniref:Uncharacterized protein n=1 Tax=Heterodera trifolii TaxID=157864 RepID=A0ABD2J7S8_9BILA
MQPSHDEYEALPDELKKGRCPYEAILEKNGLAKHLRDIFEKYATTAWWTCSSTTASKWASVSNQRPFAMSDLRPVQPPKLKRHIRPYHGLLFLDESIPNPDSKPSCAGFIDGYEPSRSFEELAHLSDLPIDQVLQIVRHYLLWARAMLIYPICTTNVFNGLLRNKLLVQLHTFFFLLPLPSIDANDSCKANQQQQQHNHSQRERGRRDSGTSNDDAEEVEEGGEEDDTETAAEHHSMIK